MGLQTIQAQEKPQQGPKPGFIGEQKMMNLTPILQKNSPRKKILSTDDVSHQTQQVNKPDNNDIQNQSKEGTKSRTDTAAGFSRNSDAKSHNKVRAKGSRKSRKQSVHGGVNNNTKSQNNSTPNSTAVSALSTKGQATTNSNLLVTDLSLHAPSCMLRRQLQQQTKILAEEHVLDQYVASAEEDYNFNSIEAGTRSQDPNNRHQSFIQDDLSTRKKNENKSHREVMNSSTKYPDTSSGAFDLKMQNCEQPLISSVEIPNSGLPQYDLPQYKKVSNRANSVLGIISGSSYDDPPFESLDKIANQASHRNTNHKYLQEMQAQNTLNSSEVGDKGKFFEYGDIVRDIGIKNPAEKGSHPNHYSSYPGQARALETRNNLITDDEEEINSQHPTLTGGRVVISHYQGIPMKKEKNKVVKKIVKKGSRPGSKHQNKQVSNILGSHAGYEKQLVLPVFTKSKDDDVYNIVPNTQQSPTQSRTFLKNQEAEFSIQSPKQKQMPKEFKNPHTVPRSHEFWRESNQSHENLNNGSRFLTKFKTSEDQRNLLSKNGLLDAYDTEHAVDHHTEPRAFTRRQEQQIKQIYSTNKSESTATMVGKFASQTASNWLQKEDSQSYNNKLEEHHKLERYKAEYRHKYQRSIIGLGKGSVTPAAAAYPNSKSNVPGFQIQGMHNIITSQQLYQHEQKLLQQAANQQQIQKAFTSLPTEAQYGQIGDSYAHSYLVDIMSPKSQATANRDSERQNDYVIISKANQQNQAVNQGLTKQNVFQIRIGGNASNREFSVNSNQYSLKQSTKKTKITSEDMNSYTDQHQILNQEALLDSEIKQKINERPARSQSLAVSYPQNSTEGSPRANPKASIAYKNQSNFPQIQQKKQMPASKMSSQNGAVKVQTKQSLNAHRKVQNQHDFGYNPTQGLSQHRSNSMSQSNPSETTASQAQVSQVTPLGALLRSLVQDLDSNQIKKVQNQSPNITNPHGAGSFSTSPGYQSHSLQTPAGPNNRAEFIPNQANGHHRLKQSSQHGQQQSKKVRHSSERPSKSQNQKNQALQQQIKDPIIEAIMDSRNSALLMKGKDGNTAVKYPVQKSQTQFKERPQMYKGESLQQVKPTQYS